MVYGRIRVHAELGAGGHGEDAGREGGGAVDIAADIRRVDRRDRIVRVIPSPLANILPSGGRRAISDEVFKGIMGRGGANEGEERSGALHI